ncbi:MAG: hypothetical protein HYY16_15880 [Planctomycetes bacterium]|nr:hypothetical protein [Planctomycetota bacterium]
MRAKARGRMQQLGWRQLTYFLKEASYQALKRWAQDAGKAHSELTRDLVEAELRRLGYVR